MKKYYLLLTLAFVTVTVFGQFSTKMEAKRGKKNFTSNFAKEQPQSSFKGTKAVFLTESFDAGTDLTAIGWSALDVDGDTYTWSIVAVGPHSGANCATSASWISGVGAVTPNNYIISPAINLTTATGTIYVDYWVRAQDQAWPAEKYKLMVSPTGGTAASDFTVNAYEEVLTAGPAAQNNYLNRKVNLSAYAGTTIRLAWVHFGCTDMFRMNLDDVQVYEETSTDGGLVSVISPSNATSCSLTATENITVRIQNFGGTDLTGFNVSYTLNGGTPVVETVSSTITPGNYLDYTFTTPVDMSTLNTYALVFGLVITNDAVASNNTLTQSVVSSDANIQIHTLTDSNGEQEWWVLNNLTSDTVQVRHIPWQWDVEITETVCVFSNQCYNVVVYDADGMEDPAYVEVLYNSTQVGGSTVAGSFTETLVVENIGSGCAADDAGIFAIAPIYSSCDLSSTEAITVTIKNFGTAAISTLDVSYKINGGTPVTETVTAAIAPSGTYDYTFTATADLSADNTYEIVAYTTLTGDANANNNSDTLTVMNMAAATIPYSSGFETAAELMGWSIEDANGDGSTWGIYTDGGVGGTAGAVYSYDATNAGEDYLYTTCLNLNAGQNYKLDFSYAAYDETYPEKLKVFIGTSNSSTAMTQQIVDLGEFITTDFTVSTTDFTVPTTGIYYIGFMAYSDADMYYILLDDVLVDFSTNSNVNVSSNKTINVFPNPTTGIININEVASEVFVYDLVGNKLMSESFTKSIDISNLAKGMYLVKVRNNDEVRTFQINLVK
ncbi:MAG: hypothetical protein CVU05_01435 [Bacteroidetes bacterium HGW-Bacteroidetes-21]|nr:MAG: hypothetical protein CVU05_01435 [Bacteroidetes bacterium HGW-Bacteroidetes-21]